MNLELLMETMFLLPLFFLMSSFTLKSWFLRDTFSLPLGIITVKLWSHNCEIFSHNYEIRCLIFFCSTSECNAMRFRTLPPSLVGSRSLQWAPLSSALSFHREINKTCSKASSYLKRDFLISSSVLWRQTSNKPPSATKFIQSCCDRQQTDAWITVGHLLFTTRRPQQPQTPAIKQRTLAQMQSRCISVKSWRFINMLKMFDPRFVLRSQNGCSVQKCVTDRQHKPHVLYNMSC